jgi:hypothetical protein
MPDPRPLHPWSAPAFGNPFLSNLVLAAAGFGLWTVFSALPMLQGHSGLREAWDTGAYWSVGLPLLVLLQAAVGASRRGPPWRDPLATILGHALAVVLVRPAGADLGLAPFAAIVIGVPLYAGLLVASLAGRSLASFRSSGKG